MWYLRVHVDVTSSKTKIFVPKNQKQLISKPISLSITFRSHYVFHFSRKNVGHINRLRSQTKKCQVLRGSFPWFTFFGADSHRFEAPAEALAFLEIAVEDFFRRLDGHPAKSKASFLLVSVGSEFDGEMAGFGDDREDRLRSAKRVFFCSVESRIVES